MMSLLVLSLVAACGEDDSDPIPPTQPQTYTCRASVNPVSLTYQVSGGQLVLTDSQGQSSTLNRVAPGSGARAIYGTWHVTTESNAAGTVSLDLEVQENKVSAIADCDFGSVSTTAVASSPATVTDTELTILQADEDVQTVKR
jgi:membrane-bound inhibitor of C-type lysozyme